MTDKVDKDRLNFDQVRADLESEYVELQAFLAEAKGFWSMLDLDLDPTQEARIIDFLADMIEQNKTLNLSAITDPHEVMVLHLLDSFSILPFLDVEAKGKRAFRFLDVGTGAGFPGVPIKIARPNIEVYLLDALAKRLKFIERTLHEQNFDTANNFNGAIETKAGFGGALCSSKLGPPVYFLHGRAEELGKSSDFRESFDFVTARAVANLSTLLEYSLPLVKVGGVFCAMKAKVDQELVESEDAPRLLGAEIEHREDFQLPGGLGDRSLVFYRKIKSTPHKYPRHNNQIKKRPL